MPLLYIEFVAPQAGRGERERERSRRYKQVAAAALKAALGSVLRRGDLAAAGSGGTWFVVLLSARPASRSRNVDADLGVAAQRLRRDVQLELARAQADQREGLSHHVRQPKDDRYAGRIAVRCGWNVLEPAAEPLEALRHAVRGAALVARVEERRATVLAAITHELRTPLTAIVGFAERLQADGARAARRRRYLDVIIEESKRLHRLAEGLIDAGAWNAGSLRLSCERHDLSTIARTAVAAVAKNAVEKQIGIEVSGSARGWVDRDRCLQIFINVIDNAVRHSPRGGRVRVKVANRNLKSLVTIEDSGPGFDDAMRRSAGVPFNLGAGGKVGLGLAIACLLTEAHGGMLELGSGRRGGLVSVTLPGARAPIKNPAGPNTRL